MSASRPIDAVFENGVFRPLAEVKLPVPGAQAAQGDPARSL